MPVLPHLSVMDRDVRNTFINLNEYIHDIHFRRWIGPGDFVNDSASPTTIDIFYGRLAAVSFPDAATTGVVANVDVSAFWTDGFIEIVFLYSGSASSTNNVRWEVLANAVAAGQTLPNQEFITAQSFPGPATAGDLKVVTFSTKITIASPDEMVFLRINRLGADAADTYAGDAYLLGIKLRYLPNKL